MAPDENKDLDATIKGFKAAWKEKYGSDVFSAMDKDKIFATEFVQTMGDTKMGTAKIVKSHDMPELELKFVAEGGKWKYDVDDAVSTPELQQNLMKAIQELVAMKAEWPGGRRHCDAHRFAQDLHGDRRQVTSRTMAERS